MHEMELHRLNMSKFMKKIEEKGFDIAFIAPGSDFYYLTGIRPGYTLERPFILIITPRDYNLVVPALYKYEIENSWLKERVLIWRDGEDPFVFMKNIIKDMEVKRALIDDYMPAGILIKLIKLMPGVVIEPLSTVMSDLRAIKSELELQYIVEACRIVDHVFQELLEIDPRGKREKDIAKYIEKLIEEKGGEPCFSPLVAYGANAANPHHVSGNELIRDNNVLILDYGARYNGYCSDITRTVFIGDVSNEIKEVYKIVLDAHDLGVEYVREGVYAEDIDSVVRNYITKHGYGDNFIHRTGHGLGLDVHEDPYIAPGNKTVLRNGMVFTIEPGIYINGKFGVRIEDDVAIIGNKGVLLTRSSREMITL
ncbi:MAG: Xaa-Pro peptidase family protein [Desulfurococcaceae archaeon]